MKKLLVSLLMALCLDAHARPGLKYVCGELTELNRGEGLSLLVQSHRQSVVLSLGPQSEAIERQMWALVEEDQILADVRPNRHCLKGRLVDELFFVVESARRNQRKSGVVVGN